MNYGNTENFDIADEKSNLENSNEIPTSCICNHFIKNSFCKNIVKNTQSKYNKSFFSDINNPILKKLHDCETPIKMEANALGEGKKAKESSYQLVFSTESSNNIKPISKKGPDKESLISEFNKMNSEKIQVKKLSQFSQKSKFIVDDYSFTPEMLLSFQKIPSMQNIPIEVISKYSLQVPTKPEVSSDKTLILDLDETLITEHPIVGEFDYITVDQACVRTCYLFENDKSITNEIKFVIRPFVLELLETLSNIYEIIVN